MSPLDLSLPYSYMTGIRVRRTHWATLAKSRSQIASGAEDICKSGGLGCGEGNKPNRMRNDQAQDETPEPHRRLLGSRVRMRRFMLNLSQEKLGKALGITFQQVQKYEKGVNRMGSSRLQQVADILGVSVPFFFEGATDGTYKPDGRAPSPAYVNEFVSSEDGLRLIKAFARITRPAVPHRIVALVREIAGDEGE